jgi:hypothetical protein
MSQVSSSRLNERKPGKKIIENTASPLIHGKNARPKGNLYSQSEERTKVTLGQNDQGLKEGAWFASLGRSEKKPP